MQKLFRFYLKLHTNYAESRNIIVEMGKNQLLSKPSTKFLGINLDNAITFNRHISELCQKLNFIILLMRCARLYSDKKPWLVFIMHFSTRTSVMRLNFLRACCRLSSQPNLPLPKSSSKNYLKNPSSRSCHNII